jgi:hypothetical protein
MEGVNAKMATESARLLEQLGNHSKVVGLERTRTAVAEDLVHVKRLAGSENICLVARKLLREEAQRLREELVGLEAEVVRGQTAIQSDLCVCEAKAKSRGTQLQLTRDMEDDVADAAEKIQQLLTKRQCRPGHWTELLGTLEKEARAHWAIVQDGQRSGKGLQMTTVGYKDVELEDGTTIDVPKLRIIMLAREEDATDATDATDAWEPCVAVVVHDGAHATDAWRKPVVLSMVAPPPTSRTQWELAYKSKPATFVNRVRCADVLMLRTGEVYVTPAGATALEFLDQLAAGRKKRHLNQDDEAIIKHAFLAPTRRDMESVVLSMEPVVQAARDKMLECGGEVTEEEDDTKPLRVLREFAASPEEHLELITRMVSEGLAFHDVRSRNALYFLGLMMRDSAYLPPRPDDVLAVIDFLDVKGPRVDAVRDWMLERIEVLAHMSALL